MPFYFCCLPPHWPKASGFFNSPGKGVCHEGQCDSLLAVPVKSFDSGDSNRDLHMVQVTRGAQFPMITVRTRLPETAADSSIIHADLEIQFAGQTTQFKQVPLQLAKQGNDSKSLEPSPPHYLTSKLTRPRF